MSNFRLTEFLNVKNNKENDIGGLDINHKPATNAGNEKNAKAFFGDLFIQEKPIRFVKKTGHCNVTHINLEDKTKLFLRDIFTTAIDLQWRWNFFMFSAAYIFGWTCFGMVYWAISDNQVQEALRANTTVAEEDRCIYSYEENLPFTSAFLFSLESQTTIGYGYRGITENCPSAIITVVIQSVFGCILDAFMIGLIFAKLSRPKRRADTLLFSENAVINMKNGKLCLMIRIANLRKSHLIETSVRMLYVHSRKTEEGEYIPLEQIELPNDTGDDINDMFLVTPQTIYHPIDEDSPLWTLHPNELAITTSNKFEIVLILEGTVEATGMIVQARASYVPSEVLWGHRFHNILTFSPKRGYKVNFRRFHDTYATSDIPICSAKSLSSEFDDSCCGDDESDTEHDYLMLSPNEDINTPTSVQDMSP